MDLLASKFFVPVEFSNTDEISNVVLVKRDRCSNHNPLGEVLISTSTSYEVTILFVMVDGQVLRQV
jgi:hypothetical protein